MRDRGKIGEEEEQGGEEAQWTTPGLDTHSNETGDTNEAHLY